MARVQTKQPNPDYEILLYYKYVRIEDPQVFVNRQKELCEKLGLKGRIIVSREGINGTVEGKKADTEAYRQALSADVRFSDIHFKKSVGTGNAFPRLSVKLRQEIVSAHLNNSATKDIDPTKVTGKHLAPEELRAWFEQGREFSIVDMRNDYEHAVGHFEGSVLPPMHNFRDLPEAIQNSELQKLKYEEKPVLTVCTGGVRCEKASGYLLKNGFKNVYQLDGGIVSYMEKYPGRDFIGSLYVFDGRVTMTFDKPEEHTVVGACAHCGAASEQYADCKEDECHFHFISCDNCRDTSGRAFCPKCKQAEVFRTI